MVSVRVAYEVWTPLDTPEHGVVCTGEAYVSDERGVPLSQIKALFPYEGVWHFRSKAALLGSWTWLDHTDESDLATVVDGCVFVRAIPIDLPNVTDTSADTVTYQTDEYMSQLDELFVKQASRGQTYEESENPSPSPNPRRYAHQRSDDNPSSFNRSQEDQGSILDKIKVVGKGLAAKAQSADVAQHVTKGMNKLWGAVKFAASSLPLGTTRTPLSDTTAEVLGSLSDILATQFSDDNQEDVAKLMQLWNALFADGAGPFQRTSPQWKVAGFMKPDPVLDLKRAGLLALNCMLFAGMEYSDRVLTLVSSQSDRVNTNYPFAIVCVNLTLMLADLLKLRDQMFLSVQANYWTLFEDAVAFQELFCVCLFYTDHLWHLRGATRTEFGAIISEVKSAVEGLLGVEPPPMSVNDMKQIAMERGMLG